MKTIERVYAHKTPYHTATDYGMQMPAGQPDNETRCKIVKRPSIAQADAFGKTLWDNKQSTVGN